MQKVDPIKISARLNPFTSNEFVKIWRHFHEAAGECIRFSPLSDIQFVKHPFLPIYINAGKRMTQGISYSINKEELRLWKNQVVVIYDVPDYYQLEDHTKSSIRCLRTPQHEAFLANLSTATSAEDYMIQHVRNKSRQGIVRARKRLEASFNIRFEVWQGPKVSKEIHSDLFKAFRSMLLKRYNAKNETHIFLKPRNWQYLEKLTWAMIRENKANIFVLYEQSNPIAINLNFINDKVLISTLPAFDVDFMKFNLGHIMTLRCLEWCFQNGFTVYDFSKGHYDYKQRWGNVPYRFFYHVLYNNKSISSRFLAHSIHSAFQVKSMLRKLPFIYILKYLKSLFQIKQNSNTNQLDYTYKLVNTFDESERENMPISKEEYPFLKPVLIEFLYRYPGPYSDLMLWRKKSCPDHFYFQSRQHTGLIYPR